VVVLFKDYSGVHRAVYMVGCGCCGEVIGLDKIRLFIKVRKRGRARIESVPVKRLVALSRCRKRHWVFEDGWLVLVGWD